MKKTCPSCKKQFITERKNKTFCCRPCIYKQYNDNRPRKTSKSYLLSDKQRTKHIPQEQVEIILGTLMGDACLILQTNNFHRMSLCHSEKQLDYLILKKELLNHIFFQKHPNRYVHKENKVQYHFGSISHKDLTNIYGLLYRKKKFISRRYLNLLTPTSLLFWYMDDGSMIKSSGNAIIFCTDSFSLSENKAIKIWLWQKFRIQSNLMQVKGSYSDNLYYRIRLNKENTIRFLFILSSSIYFQRAINAIPYKFCPYYK